MAQVLLAMASHGFILNPAVVRAFTWDAYRGEGLSSGTRTKASTLLDEDVAGFTKHWASPLAPAGWVLYSTSTANSPDRAMREISNWFQNDLSHKLGFLD